MSIGFPLLLIPLAIYNIFVFLMPGVAFNAPVTGMTLPSQAAWNPTMGDALLALGLILLLFEVVKAARPGARYLTDHLLSLIVFGAAAAEFLLLPKFGTSLFFLLTLFALVDFLTGVTLRKRRYTTFVEEVPAPASRRAARRAEPEIVEPRVEPAPASEPAAPEPAPVSSAKSIAESVLLDHPEPSMAQPAVPSPGIQPGNGAHPSPDAPPR